MARLDHPEERGEEKLFIDELNQIRLVNPALLDSSSKLASESKQFFGQFDQFLKIVREVREAMERIGQLTDRERLRVLSLQNQLEGRKGTASEEGQQVQILINERQRELDRLRVELQSLKEVEAQQAEYLAMCQKL